MGKTKGPGIKRVFVTTILHKTFTWLVTGSCLFCAIGISQASLADYVLTAPPRESPDSGRQVYAPLAEFLTDLLGEPVVYEHPQSWQRYEKKMRNDEYDIVFDGPHFAAWRIESLHNRPLVKLPGALRFVLISRIEDGFYQQPDDLIGQTICTLLSPNLGTLTLFSMFPHPARQPKYLFINGGFKEVAQAFEKGKCHAAILRSAYYFKKAPQTLRDKTRVITSSPGLTNQGITLSSRIKPSWDDKLRKVLINGQGKDALQPILDRFYSAANQFEPSKSSDYNDHNLLHDNLIFGW